MLVLFFVYSQSGLPLCNLVLVFRAGCSTLYVGSVVNLCMFCFSCRLVLLWKILCRISIGAIQDAC